MDYDEHDRNDILLQLVCILNRKRKNFFPLIRKKVLGLQRIFCHSCLSVSRHHHYLIVICDYYRYLLTTLFIWLLCLISVSSELMILNCDHHGDLFNDSIPLDGHDWRLIFKQENWGKNNNKRRRKKLIFISLFPLFSGTFTTKSSSSSSPPSPSSFFHHLHCSLSIFPPLEPWLWQVNPSLCH